MKLLLWGAGAHGRVIHDLAGACGYTDILFVDDRIENDRPARGDIAGSPICSPQDQRAAQYRHVVISQGDNRARARCFAAARSHGWEPVVLIHPSAVVSRSASIGLGTMVMPLVVVESGVSIGENCILNTACVVEHDSRVGDHVHLSAGAILGGEVTVEPFVHAGMGATVLPRLTVGCGSLVGAGAVAVHDVPPGWVVAGIPARPLRANAAS